MVARTKERNPPDAETAATVPAHHAFGPSMRPPRPCAGVVQATLSVLSHYGGGENDADVQIEAQCWGTGAVAADDVAGLDDSPPRLFRPVPSAIDVDVPASPSPSSPCSVSTTWDESPNQSRRCDSSRGPSQWMAVHKLFNDSVVIRDGAASPGRSRSPSVWSVRSDQDVQYGKDMCEAAADGDVVRVQQLMAAGAHINASDTDRCRPTTQSHLQPKLQLPGVGVAHSCHG